MTARNRGVTRTSHPEPLQNKKRAQKGVIHPPYRSVGGRFKVRIPVKYYDSRKNVTFFFVRIPNYVCGRSKRPLVYSGYHGDYKSNR